jgi:hypothetical protein
MASGAVVARKGPHLLGCVGGVLGWEESASGAPKRVADRGLIYLGGLSPIANVFFRVA